VAYLDHAATTPMLPEAVAALTAALADVGNASSLHASGRRARRLVEESREAVAEAFGARPSEVVFTAGGTESDNLAVKGLFWSRRAKDPRCTTVVVSAVEHHALLEPVEWLAEHEGATVVRLPVDALGRVDPDDLRQVVADDPDSIALVSVMWANNEVGTIQPVAALANIAAEHGIPFHTDAVQAAGQVPLDFSASGATAMTLSGHKIGGPPSVGVLLLQRDAEPVPLIHGGGQEREVRSGTLDVAGIAAMAAAATVVTDDLPRRQARLTALRDDLVRRVHGVVPQAALNGDPTLVATHRLPANAHFSFPGCEGDDLLMLLDAQGVECSTGSACSAGIAQPSHVLLAMGADETVARSSLRCTVGHSSVTADVDALIDALPAAVERAGQARGRTRP
jgi:cysteine desulfurase